MTTRFAQSPSGVIITSLAILQLAANADVLSTFDADSDGWGVVDIHQPITGVPTLTGTYTPVFAASGGTSGGCIQQYDPSGDAYFFSAPAKFLGNQSATLHGRLSWNLQCNEATNSSNSGAEQLIISDGTTSLYYVAKGPGPANTWRAYNVDFYGPSFTVGSRTGPVATDAQLHAVWSNLTSLYILGDWGYEDTSRLDDVRLLTTSGSTPPEISIAMYPGITIQGIVGATYRIDYSDELAAETWKPLSVVVLPATPYLYTDATGANVPKRFYRAIQLQ